VKCLAGAVNFLRKEAEIAALARSAARWLGSRGYLSAENRWVIARVRSPMPPVKP